MSKLEELIQELCPDGVEYKKLGDAVTINRGIRVVKSQLSENGKYPVYQNSLTPLGFYEKSNVGENTTFIIVAGAAGEIGYSCVDFWAADDCFYFSCGENILNKYIYYVLMRNKPTLLLKVRKASIPRLSRLAIEQLMIPVPPLPVQREIARILDNFTELTAELQEKLTAELTARKKQYEYYREMLFNFNGTTRMAFIPEIADVFIGLVTTMTKHYVPEGVPLIFNSSIQQNRFIFPKKIYLDNKFAEKNSNRRHKVGDVITVHTGDVGTSAIIDESLDGSLGFATIVSRINDPNVILNKYLCHFLNSNACKKQIVYMIKGDRDNLNLKDFKKIKVPIPSLEEQKRIVSILDRFDTLCNDLTSGLPAEIKARQKQYEYYRDKLLNFPEYTKQR